MEYKIEPKKSLKRMFREVVSYRHLFLVFAWRDLKLKYRQTLIGFAWVVLQPLIMMAIFTTVFSSRVDTSSNDISYPVFVFSGLIIYNVFALGISTASNSMVHHAHIIKKTYFPRIILPASSILMALVDFTVSLGILVFLLHFYGTEFQYLQFFLCSYFAFALVALPTLGFGIFFSGLNVIYRDVGFIFPFFLQIMLFISPIIYPIESVSNEVFRALLVFNPISSAMEFQKLAVQQNYIPNLEIVVYGTLTSITVLATGIFVFNKIEKTFADVI